MAETWLCQLVEDLTDRVQRLETTLDRVGISLGQGARLLGSNWEVSEHQIAQWVAGTPLPLTDASEYVRFKNGNLEIRGGAFSIQTGATGPRMEMTSAYMKTWNASDVETFHLNFADGSVTLVGTVTATAGEIGGWSIAAGVLQSLSSGDGIILDAANRTLKLGDIDPGPYLVLSGAEGYMGTSDFASGVGGWRINQDGTAEFTNIVARGVIRTPVFLKDEVSAIGGTFVVAETDVLAAGLTTPPSLEMSFYVFCPHNYFAVNDYIRCKPDENREFWGLVTAVTEVSPNYRYTVTLKAGLENGPFYAGEAVVGYGPNAQGLIQMTASLANAPYLSIFTHGSEPWTSLTEKVRLGNLAGITDAKFGALSGYGLWTDAGYFTGSIKATAGELGTLDVAGLLTVQAGGELRVGDAGTPGTNFNGIRIYRTAAPLYRIEGQKNGAVQFYVSNTGELYSGQGVANNYFKIDSLGAWVYSTGANTWNMKWKNTDVETYTNAVGFANMAYQDPNGNNYGTMDFGVYHDDNNLSFIQFFLNEFQFAVKQAGTYYFPLQGTKDALTVVGTLTVNSISSPSVAVVGDGYMVSFSAVDYVDHATRGGGFFLGHARGSLTNPTAVVNGDRLGWFLARGWDGDSWVHPCGITFKVDGAVSDGVVPGRIVFETGTTGTRTDRLIITSGGLVGVGMVPSYKLDVDGDVRFGDNQLARISEDGNTVGLTALGASKNVALYANNAATNNAVVLWGVSTSFTPLSNEVMSLGQDANEWKDVWALDTSINHSDLRDKREVIASPLGLDFILRLTPRAWRWDRPEAKRRHHGLVAQEVKQVLDDLGIDSQDFAGYVYAPPREKEDGTMTRGGHYLRYDEFIGPLIRAVQELEGRLAAVEARQGGR